MVADKHKNDWAEAVEKIAVKAIGAGYPVTLAITAVLIVLFLRMDSADIKAVLMAFVDNRILNVLGWLLFILMVWFCKFLVNVVRNVYKGQLDAQKAQIEALKAELPPRDSNLLPPNNKNLL